MGEPVALFTFLTSELQLKAKSVSLDVRYLRVKTELLVPSQLLHKYLMHKKLTSEGLSL